MLQRYGLAFYLFILKMKISKFKTGFTLSLENLNLTFEKFNGELNLSYNSFFKENSNIHSSNSEKIKFEELTAFKKAIMEL